MPHASAGLSPLASCISVSSEVVRLLHCRDVDMGCLRGHSDCHSATGRERLRERLGAFDPEGFPSCSCDPGFEDRPAIADLPLRHGSSNSGTVHLSHAESFSLGFASTASDRAPWPACKPQDA